MEKSDNVNKSDKTKVLKEISNSGSAFRYNNHLKYSILSNIGTMSNTCVHCKAKKFDDEVPTLCC